MSMLLAPLVLGAGAVGVYYLTRKNRGKKHSSRRNRSSRSSRGGWGWRPRIPMGPPAPRPMGPSIGKFSFKPPGLKGGGWGSRGSMSSPMVGTKGSGIKPPGLKGGGWLSRMSKPMWSPGPRPMGPPEPRPMAPSAPRPMVGTNGSGIKPFWKMGGKKSRKHKKH